MTVLVAELQDVVDWKRLAIFLLDDVDGSLLSGIEKSNHYDVEGCRCEMIKLFLNLGTASWEKVIESLQLAGYKNLAKKIEKRVPLKPPKG